MILLTVILALAGSVFAAPCPTDPQELAALTTPCTPTDAQKQEILDTARRAFTAETAMGAALYERNAAVSRGDAEEAEKQMKKIESNEALMKQEFANALAQAEAAYNVKPQITAGPVALPKDPAGRGAWAAGYPAQWRPQVRYELNEVREILAIDGSKHYADGTVDPAKTQGMTYPDGEVRIVAQNLRDAVSTGNPGVIAYILHHEARHFDDLVSRGWSSREADEARAYTDSAREATVFELTPEQTAKIKSRKTENMAALKSGKASSFFPDTQQELDLSMAYDQAQKNLQLYAQRREEIRRLAEQAEKNRLAKEARQRVINEYKAAVANCGFTPMMTQEDLTLGFRVAREASVYFTEPVNLAQTKAALLMTRACWAASAGGQGEGQPCTDAFDSMRANWNDAAYKHGLEVDADAGAYDGCLRAIRESAKAPGDMKSLNKIVGNYWQDWGKAARKRQMDTMRELRRQEEETGRQTRGERLPDLNYDLTPPRRALDMARRSHF